MHLRLVRSHRTIEISRYSPRGDGNSKATGDWTKQVFPTLGSGFHVKVSNEEYSLLDEKAIEILAMLDRFLKICEAVAKCDDKGRVATPIPGRNVQEMQHRIGHTIKIPQDKALLPVRRVVSTTTATAVDDGTPGPTAGPSKLATYRQHPSWSSPDISDPTATSLCATIHDSRTSTSTALPLGCLPVRPRPPKFSRTPSADSGRTASTTDVATRGRPWLPY